MRAKSKWRLLWVLTGAVIAVEIIARLAGTPELPQDPTFLVAREWSYPQWFTKDAKLFWRFRPSKIIKEHFPAPGEYIINSQGFRGPDIDGPKPDSVVRIVCLGGATTFGWGVAENEAYPRRLESHLNKLDTLGRRWQVINAGVPDYSTFQGIALARRWFPRWTPDVVLINYAWGDHQPAPTDASDKDLRLPPSWCLAVDNLLMQSVGLRWAKRVWTTLSPPHPPDSNAAFKTWRVDLTDFGANIETLTRLAKANGARVVVVSSPIAWPPPGQSDSTGIFRYHHRYHRIARYAAVSSGVEFAELANVFNLHPQFYDDPSKDIEHFNAAGHAFAGEFLARFLLGLPPNDTVFTPFDSR